MEDSRRRGRLDTVLKYAKEHGYKSIEYRGEWENSDVYELIMKEEEIYIGLPRFAIVSEKKFKLSTDEETFEILDHIRKGKK